MLLLLFAFVLSLNPQRAQANVLADLGMDFCCGSGPTSQGPTSDTKGLWILGGTTLATGATTLGLVITLFKTNRSAAVDYSDKNLAFLLSDISRGEGEYLDTYATLLGCRSREGIEQFSRVIQFQIFGMDSGTTSAQQLTELSADVLHNNPALWIACSSSPILTGHTQTASAL